MKVFIFAILCVTLAQCAPSDEQQLLTRVRRTKGKHFEGGLGGILDGFLNINKGKEVQTSYNSEAYPQPPPPPHRRESSEESDERTDGKAKGFNFFKELNVQIGAGLDGIKKGIEHGIGLGKEFGFNLNIGVGGKKTVSKPDNHEPVGPPYARPELTTIYYNNGNKGVEYDVPKAPEAIVPTIPEVAVPDDETWVPRSKPKAAIPYDGPETDGSHKLDLRNNDPA